MHALVFIAIALLFPQYGLSQKVIVPKIIYTGINISRIYKDTLIGHYVDNYKETNVYSRDMNLLWSMKKKHSHNFPSIGNNGYYYVNSNSNYNIDVFDIVNRKKITEIILNDISRKDSAFHNIRGLSNDYLYAYNKAIKNHKVLWTVGDILSFPNHKTKGRVGIRFIDSNNNIIVVDEDSTYTISDQGKLLSKEKDFFIFRSYSNGNSLNYTATEDPNNSRRPVVFLDENSNALWEKRYPLDYTVHAEKSNSTYFLNTDGIAKVNNANGNTLWYNKLKHLTSIIVSDSNTLYSNFADCSKIQSSECTIGIHAISENNGSLLWEGHNLLYVYVLDQTGILYTANGYKVQTSSKGLARKGWPMKNHDPRRTNNASSPIYLKEYPNNNNHKKVICEVDNKTIDINKLTHLKKGWHLLGNSYETKDYCPFSNIDYVYYYDTINKKFNKININDESTHKVIPKYSGFFIHNKHDDNLTIHYDKEEILEKDKNLIDKEYINTIGNGWHLLGSSDSIQDMSMFKDTKDVYIYDNVKGYTLLDSKSASNSIKEYSGFWVHK